MESDFIRGARDLHHLLNRGYPKRPAVKMVGDRYRLSGTDRIILYRGIFSNGEAESRMGRRCPDPRGKTLQVDGYNILFSLVNHLAGRPLFIANDGFLRDAGSCRGNPDNPDLLDQAFTGITGYLHALQPGEVIIYLDRSIAGFHRHTSALQRRMSGFKGRISPVPSADRALLGAGYGIIVTSDTGIIDQSPLMITDLLGVHRVTGSLPALPFSPEALLNLQTVLHG